MKSQFQPVGSKFGLARCEAHSDVKTQNRFHVETSLGIPVEGSLWNGSPFHSRERKGKEMKDRIRVVPLLDK